MIEKSSKFEQLYLWQREQIYMKEFILHDGPPYANGDVHIGHAVNKVLKDITLRNKLLNGFKVHFVPGWDCHGLPIELQILKGNFSSEKNPSALDIRQRAYEFSQITKESQCKAFIDWGILADWKNNYATCSSDYVVQQLNIFQELYDKNLIYRDCKPVFWSPVNKTSLAEAELEYNTSHVSPSVYLKFHVTRCPETLKSNLDPNLNLSILIWTTTPWSLPANQAVCFSPDKKYSIVHNENKQEYYVVATEMISLLSSVLKTELNVTSTFEGHALKELKYSHPILKNRECSLFPGYHVTTTKGTGLVHTAPNHGLDDFVVAQKMGLAVDDCLVDEAGCYTNSAGKDLEGKFVLNEGTKSVIKLIENDILCLEDYTHSYPHDWRSKTPVIIRNSFQWFIDVQQIKEEAKKCLQSVNIIPCHLKKAFLNQLDSSPQWCISRQRVWGVPIPAFYAAGESSPIVNRDITNNLCNLIKKHGIHCWWTMDSNELLPPFVKEKNNLHGNNYERSSDIMDIWFDSGISWKNVLPEPHVADVCIEGVDQIRGWFNSSLLTSVALRKKAPYKALFLHGFTTDADGRKMSKSEGNVISPTDIINGLKSSFPAYGVDVLRWWVATHACQHDNIAVKPNIIEECSQNLNRIRNTFKFLLGSLHDFDPENDCVEAKKMRPLDLYMLHRLNLFLHKLKLDYDAFEYKNVSKDILNFTVNEVSSFYCHLIKDRLYCESKYSTGRLSSQTVLYFLLNTLMKTVGPICPHLGEEICLHHPNAKIAKEGLFRSQLPCLEDYISQTFSPVCVTWANQIREAVLKAEFKTLDMHMNVTASDAVINMLQALNKNVEDNSGLLEIFQVSEISFSSKMEHEFDKSSVTVNQVINDPNDGNSYPCTVILSKSKQQKCPRCRRFSSTTSSTICDRCSAVVNNCVPKQFNAKVS